MKIYWLNNLRVLSLFAMIILHVSYVGFYQFGVLENSEWLIATVIDSLVRFCVPVFLMITGALLLGNNDKPFVFLKRRVSRILYPFVFWSFVYILYNLRHTLFTEELDSLFFDGLKMFKNGAFYHFWYVYMLIGMYLAIPIFSIWIRSAKKNEIEYFLIIWIIVLFSAYPHLGSLKSVIDLRYFTGYIGYLVLGYYLANIKIANKTNAIIISVLLFFIGFIGTFFPTYLTTLTSGAYNELYFNYLTPNVVLLSTGVFLLVRNIWIKPSFIVEFINPYVFGIYLVHALILVLLSKFGINVFTGGVLLGSLISTILSLILSIVVVVAMSRLPIIRKYVT